MNVTTNMYKNKLTNHLERMFMHVITIIHGNSAPSALWSLWDAIVVYHMYVVHLSVKRVITTKKNLKYIPLLYI